MSLKRFEGQKIASKEKIAFNFFEDYEKNLAKYTTIIGKSTYLLPRLHTSVHLLVNEAFQQKKPVKVVTSLIHELLNGYLFNEGVYQTLKTSVRPKCLQIGLNLWNLVCERAIRDLEDKQKESILKELLSMNFCIVFVRNLQAHKGKGILFDAASAAKNNLLKLIEGSKL